MASLFAFSLGALVPLLPYLLGWPALAASLGITTVAVITGGMTVGRLTGRPGCPAREVNRQAAATVSVDMGGLSVMGRLVSCQAVLARSLRPVAGSAWRPPAIYASIPERAASSRD